MTTKGFHAELHYVESVAINLNLCGFSDKNMAPIIHCEDWQGALL